MGKIIIDQYILCETFESAKLISKAFDSFKFKFYGLGSRSSVQPKRYIRKNPAPQNYIYRVVIRYSIEYDGEFLEYGFLDKRSRLKYPELVSKLSGKDAVEKMGIIFEYQCLEDEACLDIYYYDNFEDFFDSKLKPFMNTIYLAGVVSFANEYRTDAFGIYYTENNINYERGYFAKSSYDIICPNEYFAGVDITPIALQTVWNWMQKWHKYAKDRTLSKARPLTALSYALNRSNYERTFYSVVGLESVFTNSEKHVRRQLKSVIPKIFSYVTEEEIDLIYTKRSDFAHGDIYFPDFYESSKITSCWSDLTNAAQTSTSLLIMTLRELVKNDAIKILLDERGNIIFKKHKRIFDDIE